MWVQGRLGDFIAIHRRGHDTTRIAQLTLNENSALLNQSSVWNEELIKIFLEFLKTRWVVALIGHSDKAEKLRFRSQRTAANFFSARNLKLDELT